jgi:hypothetical protein
MRAVHPTVLDTDVASLLGEGFDCPALDTLFLAPGWIRGSIVQWAGPISRPPGAAVETASKSRIIRIGEACNVRSFCQRLPFRCDLLGLERGWRRCTGGCASPE